MRGTDALTSHARSLADPAYREEVGSLGVLRLLSLTRDTLLSVEGER